MGFWSGVCSFVSSACSVIGSAIGTIGKAIAGVASSFIKTLGPLIDVVSTIIKAIGEHFGVLKPEDDLEEMGAKAMKSDKKVDDFDTVEEYIEHLRNEIELDKNEMKNRTEGQKKAQKAVGMAITNEGLEAKLGIKIPAQFWGEIGKHSMNLNEVKSIIDSFKSSGLELSSMSKYLNNELEEYKDRKETGSALCEAYKNSNPEMSMEEIEDKVLGLKSKD